MIRVSTAEYTYFEVLHSPRKCVWIIPWTRFMAIRRIWIWINYLIVIGSNCVRVGGHDMASLLFILFRKYQQVVFAVQYTRNCNPLISLIILIVIHCKKKYRTICFTSHWTNLTIQFFGLRNTYVRKSKNNKSENRNSSNTSKIVSIIPREAIEQYIWSLFLLMNSKHNSF